VASQTALKASLALDRVKSIDTAIDRGAINQQEDAGFTF